MFTAITIEYLGSHSKVGGRPVVTSTLNVDCVWDESIKYSQTVSAGQTGPRIQGEGIDAKVTLLFENVTTLNATGARIIKDGRSYKIVEVIPAVLDLGLDGTYDLLLKEEKDEG